MELKSILRRLTTEFDRFGLNVIGTTSVQAYDAHARPHQRSEALLPGASSILVVGSGGRAFWDHFIDDLRKDPRHLTATAHPLDAFARRAVLRADGHLGSLTRRWFWAAADADIHLDFRTLGLLAGLGTKSRLGLLLHPQFGPWVGLRAACFLGHELPQTPAPVVDPCEGCSAPCITACPGGAFPRGVWDVDLCGDFHAESTLCQSTCHARLACPVGAEHRYPLEEIAYHYNRTAGRRWLRTHLGIADEDDRFEGDGPHWGNWRTRI